MYRERMYKLFYILSDRLKEIISWLINFSKLGFTLASLFFITVFIFYVGFYQKDIYKLDITHFFNIAFILLFLFKIILELSILKKRKRYIWYLNSFLLLLGIAILYYNNADLTTNHSLTILLKGKIPLILASTLLIISELNKLVNAINTLKIPPTLLFVLSFVLIIIIGSGLLMLPKAHLQDISYLDSLFTSTSAVCVTGLIVVDTATAFTPLGKIFILSLIQIGGLGIMTFTGFFSYVFTGSASLRERVLLKDMLSTENLGNLFKILTKIILITFLTEIVGAVIIYHNLPSNFSDKIFFSIFHSISAFCNAGFSTLSQGLSSPELQFNQPIYVVIALLIILGGIGFPVLLSIYIWLKYIITTFIKKLQQKQTSLLGRANINTMIVLTTTLIILALGTSIYFILERNTSMIGLSLWQKLVTSFFGSASARTAGFNIVDITKWSYPTIFIMIFLMWVGASPGSTGGGIKTTTFAIAIRTTFSFIRGKRSVEIRKREIGNDTITRVLVIIFLSLTIILAGFMGLLIIEPQKNPIHLLFECFSAFGTVGLSLVNTSSLHENSKIILIILMFIGRVSPLALMTGIFISSKKQYYKYPTQDLIIN